METYKNLTLIIVDRSRQPLGVGCGYFYLIQNNHSAHTAFRTKKALKLWLQQTGLKIGKRYCAKSTCVRLVGAYEKKCYMWNNDLFNAKFNHLNTVPVLSNGSFVTGYKDVVGGMVIIHYQNPNTNRLELDYQSQPK